MIFVFDKSSQNKIYQFSDLNPITSPNEGMMLNVSGQLKFDFKLMVNDQDFDNDDNPYGKFIFHMYTNMDNLTDIEQNATIAGKNFDEFNDFKIPLIDCQ